MPHDHDAPHAPGVAVVDLTDPAERDRIHALVDACEAADGHVPFGDHELLAIQTAAIEDHVGLGVESGDGLLAGYGHLSRAGESWIFEIAVRPDARGMGIATMIMDAIVAHASAHGGGTLSTWVYRQTGDVGGLARRAGLRPARTLLQMRMRPLPAAAPALPGGETVDRFRPGRDEDAWLDLNARAFADVPDQGAWTRRDLDARLAAPWFDPGDVLTVRRAGRIAASCWTKLDPRARTLEGEQIGEIYVMAVDPSEAGAGLGRSLAAAGLAHLRGRGATVGMLYVDRANVRAVSMYAAMGFLTHHEDVCLVTDVPPAPDASSRTTRTRRARRSE